LSSSLLAGQLRIATMGDANVGKQPAFTLACPEGAAIYKIVARTEQVTLVGPIEEDIRTIGYIDGIA